MQLHEIPHNDWLKHLRESTEDQGIIGVSARTVQEEFKMVLERPDACLCNAACGRVVVSHAEAWRSTLDMMSTRGFGPPGEPVALAGRMSKLERKRWDMADTKGDGKNVRAIRVKRIMELPVVSIPVAHDRCHAEWHAGKTRNGKGTASTDVIEHAGSYAPGLWPY